VSRLLSVVVRGRRLLTVRIALPDHLATFIAARIAGFDSEAPERLRWAARYVTEFSALPLYRGWTETIGILANGEMVAWSTEEE
jgi:hypothetical protein